MKTFNRTFLPDSITHNGNVYKRDTMVMMLKEVGTTLKEYVTVRKTYGIKVILCNVLSKNLRGKIDLWGKPYEPTHWIFISQYK